MGNGGMIVDYGPMAFLQSLNLQLRSNFGRSSPSSLWRPGSKNKLVDFIKGVTPGYGSKPLVSLVPHH